ncbi:MAG: hypothetical protein WA432_04785 [Candidatus Babeliaceae bacterium]
MRPTKKLFFFIVLSSVFIKAEQEQADNKKSLEHEKQAWYQQLHISKNIIQKFTILYMGQLMQFYH